MSEYRRVSWWLFPVAFGVGNILFHQTANEIARQTVRLMGLGPFLWSTRFLAVAGVLAVLFFFRRTLLRNHMKLKRLGVMG